MVSQYIDNFYGILGDVVTRDKKYKKNNQLTTTTVSAGPISIDPYVALNRVNTTGERCLSDAYRKNSKCF